jgi:lipoate-protein ligase A
MKYPIQSWRLLISPPAPGAWNMAVDEMILEEVEQNNAPSTLRLYAWVPPCLSLGYAQPRKDIDLERIHALEWDWIRRPTGGRAILHTDELTYSVIAPLSDPRVSGGVLESYQRLSSALLSALHILNLPAESQPNKSLASNHESGAVCFEVPSNYEITVQGKKLIGSAQARRKNALLQHGTFPLGGDLSRIAEALFFTDEVARHNAASRLLTHATTAETILERRIPWQQAANAFMVGFQSELNLDYNPVSLSKREIQRVNELLREKYAHSSWLDRV